MILVDANVWIDVIQDDPVWGAWSAKELARARNRDEVAINPIIAAEVSLAREKIAATGAPHWMQKRASAACRLPHSEQNVMGILRDRRRLVGRRAIRVLMRLAVGAARYRCISMRHVAFACDAPCGRAAGHYRQAAAPP